MACLRSSTIKIPLGSSSRTFVRTTIGSTGPAKQLTLVTTLLGNLCVFYCRDCRRFFSLKTGATMHKGKIGLQKWATVIYLISTNLKGVSRLKLHRKLCISQNFAWKMAHRIGEGQDQGKELLTGTVETDEIYVYGKELNKRALKNLLARRS